MLVISQSEVKVSELVKQLQSGAVVAMPTETAYGLVADSTNRKAVEKIYHIKGRKYSKPLPLICSSLYMVKRFFYLPQILEGLAKKYWPGALSLQLKVKSRKLKVKTLSNTLVVRVSANDLLTRLSRNLGRPLTATSANVSGTGELYSGQAVFNQFKTRKYKPDIVVDGGVIKKRKPSTIISFNNGTIKVLRQGGIKL